MCTSGFLDDVMFPSNGPNTDTGRLRIGHRDSPDGAAKLNTPGAKSAIVDCLGRGVTEGRSTHSEERTSASPGRLDDVEWQFMQLDVVDRCDAPCGRPGPASATLTTTNGGGGGSSSSERRDSGVGFSLTRPRR